MTPHNLSSVKYHQKILSLINDIFASPVPATVTINFTQTRMQNNVYKTQGLDQADKLYMCPRQHSNLQSDKL